MKPLNKLAENYGEVNLRESGIDGLFFVHDPVTGKNAVGFADSGRLLYDFDYDLISPFDSYGVAMVMQYDKDGKAKYGFMDIPKVDETTGKVSANFADVKEDGTFFVKCKFDDILSFESGFGYGYIKMNGVEGYINLEREVFTTPEEIAKIRQYIEKQRDVTQNERDRKAELDALANEADELRADPTKTDYFKTLVDALEKRKAEVINRNYDKMNNE